LPSHKKWFDETLSWTIGYWIEEMQNKFGNPENLTVKEMVEKYRYTQMYLIGSTLKRLNG